MNSVVLVSLLGGFLLATGLYMLLRRNLLRGFLGLALLSSGINLVIFALGGMRAAAPAFVAEGASAPAEAIANPLPQALVLTAIVIGFGLMSFALTLARRAYDELGTADGDELGGPSINETASRARTD